jgi:hypothetical protein
MAMFKKFINSWYAKPLIIGLLIRIFLMPITLHPDLWGHSFTAYFFAYEWKLNIYEHLLSLPSDYPLVRNFGVGDIFIYPPLTYFTLGIFRFLSRPFTDANFLPWVMENMSLVYQRKDLYWNLFVYKFPYLFVDLGMIYFFTKLFKEDKKKKIALLLMLFNPLSLYSTFMIGQIDILPVFFTVLSLYFYKNKKLELSLLSLGVGGSYKMYPLLFVLPLAFIGAKQLLPRLKLAFLGFLPFILTIIPYLGSEAFRGMVLFSPKNQKMLFMGLNVSGAEVIYIFIALLSGVDAFLYYTRKNTSLANIFLCILLLIFSVTHYHPQWFLWITPFLIYQQVRDNFKYWEIVLTFLISWLIITLFFEASLSFGLFNPLYPALNSAKSISEFLATYTDVFQLKSLIRSVFAGFSFYYIYRLFKESSNINLIKK